MEKKIIALVIILLCVFSTMLTYKSADVGGSAQEAVQKSGRNILETIHEEKVSSGEVIFFIKNSLDYGKGNLAVGYVKKTPLGWKWIYGGEHGSIISACYNNGFSAQFFPAVDGTPFPIYFGAIIDPRIDEVKVVEQQRNITSKAKIVVKGDLKVWYLFMNNLKGSKFSIKAYSKGEEISVINDDVTPYSADQSPMKQ